MIANNPLESSKTELTLGINSFDNPKELNDVAAWSQLMLNLIFLRPGTYPSMPQMGVGIESYQYEFIDEAIDELSAAITTQQQNFLPDIPLAGTKVYKIDSDGQPVLVIQFVFNTNAGTTSTAVAINMSKRNFLDFEVSW